MHLVPLGDIPQHYAELKPADAVAIQYPAQAVTWSDLARRTNQRARMYQSLGVRQDDLVTLAVANGPDFHEAVFAVWKLGATPIIVSHRLPSHEFRAILDLVKPSLVIGGPADLGDSLEWSAVPANADLTGIDSAHLPSRVAAVWRGMTSGGSTGLPKVILDRTPASLDLSLPGSQTVVDILPGDVVLNPGPLYHTSPFLAMHKALFLGAHVVGMTRFDAEECLSLIERHKVTWMSVVPTMMGRIWALPAEVRERYALSSLRTVWHMAAPCPAWLKQAWIDWLGPDRIWELYGGTESIGTTIISGRDWLAKPGSVGKVTGDRLIAALREDGALCAPGEVGELYFKSGGTAQTAAYLGAEAKTVGGGWQTYGDMGAIDEDGYLFLADRRVDMLLRGGANIYPAEVEAAIDAHPGVETAVVVGLPCPDLGQRVHAIVKRAPGASVTVDELASFVRERLAPFKQPESYEFTEDALRNEAGKVRRSALRDEREAWLKSGVAFQHLARRPSPPAVA